jgi:hypothetical protein
VQAPKAVEKQTLIDLTRPAYRMRTRGPATLKCGAPHLRNWPRKARSIAIVPPIRSGDDARASARIVTRFGTEERDKRCIEVEGGEKVWLESRSEASVEEKIASAFGFDLLSGSARG